MPLPIGHAAVGLAVSELFPGEKTAIGRLKAAVVVAVLSNLPDVDVVLGLILQWNGSAFHRGPTHSLLFALVMGLLASRAWRVWAFMPKMSAGACTGVVLSHLLADRFLSGGPMSLLWPLEVGYATGHSGWGEVVRTVAFDGWQDNGIILAAVVFIVAVRFAKNGLAAAGDARGPRHAVQPAAARRTLPFKG